MAVVVIGGVVVVAAVAAAAGGWACPWRCDVQKETKKDDGKPGKPAPK
jgi:hypothetical protein